MDESKFTGSPSSDTVGKGGLGVLCEKIEAENEGARIPTAVRCLG